LVKTSIRYFEEAVRIDPEYSLGYAGLARANALLRLNGSPELHRPAKEAATRALEIDEKLAEPHETMALLLFADWDWAGAEREFKRFIELNPSAPRMGYAIYLVRVGRFDEAIRESELSQQLDPLSFMFKAAAGNIYLLAGRHDRALEQLRPLVEAQPNNWIIRQWLGQAYIMKGLHTEGLSELRKAEDLSGLSGSSPIVAWAYAVSGNRSEAIKRLNESLKLQSSGARVSKVGIAAVYTALGDSDQAFAWLEKAYQERSEDVVGLKVYPAFDRLRSDARYQDLLRRIGVPQ